MINDKPNGEKINLPSGWELSTAEKIGKIYDALRGDIEGTPGIFEQLRTMRWQLRIVFYIALLALLLNNPIAMKVAHLIGF